MFCYGPSRRNRDQQTHLKREINLDSQAFAKVCYCGEHDNECDSSDSADLDPWVEAEDVDMILWALRCVLSEVGDYAPTPVCDHDHHVGCSCC